MTPKKKSVVVCGKSEKDEEEYFKALNQMNKVGT